ncbi:MAG TPA: hypothetical protein VL633_11830 [Bacteroidota bacterium]|nr:hypothetical protein [Bacteroidota bacterium]
MTNSVIQLAKQISVSPDLIGVLVLEDPQMTTERLKSEVEDIWRVLKNDVARRLRLVMVRDKTVTELKGKLDQSVSNSLRQRLSSLKPGEKTVLPSPDFYFVILQILVNQWMRKSGPVSTKWLMETAGCSYPTVASALHRLRYSLTRRSYKRVELRRFPEEDWYKLAAVSERFRSTIRFADRSGRPQSPDELLRRLRKFTQLNIAVAGTMGAKHYYPDLNILGNPRLDLAIHAPQRNVDLSFLDDIDPGLKRIDDVGEPASLVVHFVRSAKALFEKGGDHLPWADPASCLLDLNEMRFEPQAREFIENVSKRNRNG